MQQSWKDIESLGPILKISHGLKRLKDKGAIRQRAACLCISIDKYVYEGIYSYVACLFIYPFF